MLDSLWTVAVERLMWKASALKSSSVRADKRQYTARMRSVETSEWFRLSWVHSCTEFAHLFRWNLSWNLMVSSLPCSVVVFMVEMMSYEGQGSQLAHCFVVLYWTGATLTSNGYYVCCSRVGGGELGGGWGKNVTYISHSQDLLHFKFTALGNKLSLCALPSGRI